jgi:hypothetical protein
MGPCGGDPRRPVDWSRIADAIAGLRDCGVPVEVSTQVGSTTYLVARPAYRAKVVVSPSWVGLDFELVGQDGRAVPTYGVDTDLHDISLGRYRWFAVAMEADIVLLLEALARGEVLVDTASPRVSMIAPTREGVVWVRQRRFGTTRVLYVGGVGPAMPPGFRVLDP